MSTAMEELDQLLAELEATKRALSAVPSPVSFQENVADTFASSLQNAIQIPSPETAASSQQTNKVEMNALSNEDKLFSQQAVVPESIHQPKHPSLSDRRPPQTTQPVIPSEILLNRHSNDNSKVADTTTTNSVLTNLPQVPLPKAETGNATSTTTSTTTNQSKSKQTCAQCNQPITGAYVRALDKDWHMDHLSCTVCTKILTPTTIYEQEGHLYCHQHHSELNQTQCAFCQGAITDKCVVALDKHWHVDHFFCSQCGKPLTSVGFHEHQGKAYCDEDYFALFAPQCGACNKPVMADCFAALNQSWHPQCFVCTKCLIPFANGVFFSFEDKPYCETHYHFMRGSLCPKCSKPIVGKCVNAIGKKWHPEHFACSFCATGLNKMPFREKEGTVFCVPCHTRLYG